MDSRCLDMVCDWVPHGEGDPSTRSCLKGSWASYLS